LKSRLAAASDPRPRLAGRRGRVTVAVRAPAGLRGCRTTLADDARRALRLLGEAPCELSIALVGDGEIHALNRTYRGKDRPTDVLAFAQREGGSVLASELLGDVVISFDSAARQARRRGVCIADELRHLLVHGILHLLGYDHERSPAEARRMFRRAREVLALLRSSGSRSMRKTGEDGA
jgi:probable rRNA maturation factor